MISPTLIDLLTHNGFNALFEKNLRDLKSPHIKAYEKTEEEFKRNFGRTKYSSFDSFRRVRYRKRRGK